MGEYNLLSTDDARWLTPNDLSAVLVEAFPGTEAKNGLVPAAPVSLWVYVPDGDNHTAEVLLDETGRMVSFTDASRGLVA